MKLIFKLFFVFAAFTGFSFAAQPAEDLSSIVFYKEGMTDDAKESLAYAMQAKIVRDMPEINAMSVVLTENSQAALSTKAVSSTVKRVSPDPKVKWLSEADPSSDHNVILPFNWSKDSYTWSLTHIGINKLDVLPSGNGIMVAVLDTGMDPVVAKKLKINKFAYKDFIDKKTVPSDEVGHGTFVTALINGKILNAKGQVFSIVPGAGIMVGKVVYPDGEARYSNIAQGILWAVKEGAKIINISLSSAKPNPVLESAVDFAKKNKVLIVAAAGNSGKEVEYPAAYASKYDNVIAVGASDDKDQRASFSSWGDSITCMAPGVNIESMNKDGSFAVKKGTSFSAPHVTGAAVIIYDRLSTSNLFSIVFTPDPERVRQQISQIAGKKGGLIDLGKLDKLTQK